jgi:RNA polymerase sigma factor (sigma-70 family)
MQNTNLQIDVWKAFQTGEERAFHHIYTTYYNDLYNYCFSILRNQATAEDCVQDFFVHLWRKKSKLIPKSTIKILLIGILRNFTLDFIRKTKCRLKHSHQFSLENPKATVSFEQLIIQSEIAESKKNQVFKLINTLTNQQREALYLRYYESMDINEIADVMKLSYAATAKHLSRATKILEQRKTLIN